MDKDRCRLPRYPFFAQAHIAETQTEIELTARTTELSRYGCYIDMMNPFLTGTTVKIELHHNEETIKATGKVVYSQSDTGMGVYFETIADGESILETWLDDLRGSDVLPKT